jgi:hypothetical protein
MKTLLKILFRMDKKVNTADLVYDQLKHRPYVPTFWGEKVMAYKLITTK